MSATGRIPTILQAYTAGQGIVTIDADNLTDLLDGLEASYPGIKGRLIDDTGALRRFVNVYVDDDDVRFLDGLATRIRDRAAVSIIPAVAGG
jgi:molybdopterin converting factor small subunit